MKYSACKVSIEHVSAGIGLHKVIITSHNKIRMLKVLGSYLLAGACYFILHVYCAPL